MIALEKRDECGAPATRVVLWPDGDRTYACAPCALSAVELAREHGTVVRVETLP